MKIVQRAILAMLSLSLVISGNLAAFALDDGIFIWPNDNLPGQHNIRFSDGTGDYFSYLANPTKFQDSTVDPTCSSLSDQNCSGSSLIFNSVLPYCDAKDSINCIEEVGAITPQGERIVGNSKFRFPLRAQNEYQGSPTDKLPSGTSSTVFEIPGASHLGGTDYLTTVFMSGTYNQITGPTLENFVVRITPVKIVPSSWTCQQNAENSCPDSGFTNILGNDGVRRWGAQGPGTDGVQSCVIRSLRENKCAETFNFPRDFRFYAKVKTNLSPSGWLHGRVYDPAISITNSQGTTEISVEASPVWVPILYKSNFWKDLPENIRSEYNPSTGLLIGGSNAAFSRIPLPNQNDPLTRNLTLTPSPSGNSGMRELQLWLPFLNDKATVIQSAWQIRSLTAAETFGANSCFIKPNELTGIVATNSTQYSAGPPTFNTESGSLDYKVASPHFDSFGLPFKGQYSLLMRSNVARCVYGFNDAPIKAELTVLSSDGSPQVASLTINESNGWLRMNASNFGFSAPTIKATLKQEVATPTPTPTPTVTATPTPSASPVAKKVTITCVKGKSVKKVTAVKPVCPKGYKKK